MQIHYSKNIAWQDYFDIVYIFNELTHEAYVLEDSSRQFWLLIEKNSNFGKICDILSDRYADIPKSQIENDFKELVEQLLETDLIQIEAVI